MQKQYDSISFECFDARDAKEPWAVEFGADKEPAISSKPKEQSSILSFAQILSKK